MAARLTTYVVVAIVAATLIAGLMVGAQRDDSEGPVDLIVSNAKVYTAGSSGTMAEAVAVRGNQILRVGSNREINRLRRPQTVVIDAHGAAVLPGFNDASTHFINGGLALDEVDLTGATTPEEVQGRVQVWTEAHPDATWIVGRNWNPTVSSTATRQLLDAVAADRLVYLQSADGRTAWLNTKALQRAAITRRSQAAADGAIIKDSRTGLPTGVLKGSAVAMAEKTVPGPSRAQRAHALRAAIDEAHRQGFTSIHDTIDRADDFLLYDGARHDGDLAIRVYASVTADDVAEAELFKQMELLSSRYPDDPLFKMGGVRISLDGAVESQEAALLQPYENRTDYQGPDRMDPDVLNRLVRLLDARDWQVTIESHGDRAVRLALNAFEHAVRSNANPRRGRRHQLEGIALVDAVDVPRFAKLSIVSMMRPDDMVATSERLEGWTRAVGPERSSRAWPAGSLVSARGQLAFTATSPSGVRPFEAMQVAVTRSTADGLPEDGWSAAERISLKRAINAFTAVPAYASFDEQRKGTLKKGMLADLVVLSNDIFDTPVAQLGRTTVVATIFDGKIVYQRSAKSTN